MTTTAIRSSFTRKLELTMPDSGEVRDIEVRIGLPEPDARPGGDFRALVEIDGFEEPYARHVCGVDELQALLGGCWLVPHLLQSMVPEGARLTWLGEEDLGFGSSPRAP
jgi:hypothetical protein